MSITNTGMRIASHEIMIRMYNDEKDRLEERLNKVNEKIIFHTTICQFKKSTAFLERHLEKAL